MESDTGSRDRRYDNSGRQALSTGSVEVVEFRESIMERANSLEKLDNGLNHFPFIGNCGRRMLRQNYVAVTTVRMRQKERYECCSLFSIV